MLLFSPFFVFVFELISFRHLVPFDQPEAALVSILLLHF